LEKKRKIFEKTSTSEKKEGWSRLQKERNPLEEQRLVGGGKNQVKDIAGRPGSKFVSGKGTALGIQKRVPLLACSKREGICARECGPLAKNNEAGQQFMSNVRGKHCYRPRIMRATRKGHFHDPRIRTWEKSQCVVSKEGGRTACKGKKRNLFAKLYAGIKYWGMLTSLSRTDKKKKSISSLRRSLL